MLRAVGFLPESESEVPDFLPPLLWSVYLVTTEARSVATGLGINKDTLGGSEQASVKASKAT